MSDNSHSWSAKVGATPRKLAVVAILFVVLVVTAYLNFGPGTNNATDVAVKPRPRLSAVRSGPTAPKKKGNKDNSQSPQLRRIPLARAAEWPSTTSLPDFDPFAKPEFLNSEEEEQLPPTATKMVSVETKTAETSANTEKSQPTDWEGAVKSLKELGVELIVQSPSGAIAKIGGREVSVGDEINGLLVTHIDAAGIVVAIPNESKTEDGTSSE